MSDQGIWFKLWDGWENDAALAELSKEDLLHWVLLGGYLKKHGNNGMICLSKPATALQKKLMLPSYEAVLSALKRFPNCTVEEKQNSDVTEAVTVLTIQWKNWVKYQGDSSKFRVQKWRVTHKDTRVTAKKRREEKREEEKENIPPLAPQGASKILEWFEKTWQAYPKERRVGKKAAFRSYQKAVKTLEEAKAVARALESYLKSKTVTDGFLKNASTFFANWEDYRNDDGRNRESLYDAAHVQGPEGSAASGRSQAESERMLRGLADRARFPGEQKSSGS